MNEGGHFSLSVRVDERDALVTVVDDGAGISNEVLQRALDLALSRRFTDRAYTARIPLPAHAARSSSRRRILVVDDRVEVAESLGALLRDLGHDVQLAHDGQAALETARLSRPELVLLGLGIPGVGAYGVIERLRKDARLAHVRFVAVARSTEEAQRARSSAAGFDEYVVNPLDVETLRSLFERL